MTLVTVIVPCFNYARYLGEALDSVRAQTHTEWECIVVDDGSTDDTAAVAQRYASGDARFRYVYQTNGGLAAARNRGIAEARGEYVQFLDADDRLLPRKLEWHASFLDEHPRTDIVYSEAAYFRSEQPERLMPSLHGKLSRSIMTRVHGSDEALRKLEHMNIMPVPAALVRRNVFTRALFDVGVRAYEDWAFWIRCAVAGCRFDHLDTPDPVAAIRVHPESMSRNAQTMLRGLIDAARAFAATAPRDTSAIASRLPLIYELALGIDAVDRGAHREGRARMRIAARHATETLTRIRWSVYALAALLPRRAFLAIVAWPMPEAPFEIYRRLRGLFSR